MAAIGGRGDKLDLNFRQGATFGPVLVRMTAPSGQPIDLTGAEIRAAVRKTYQAATAFDVDCQLVDPVAGHFTFTVSHHVTASMPTGTTPTDPASLYVWDLEIAFPNDTVMPVFFGTVKVAPEAAR